MSKIGKQMNNILVLKGPRITEKATASAEMKSGPAYIFEIAHEATKPMVMAAFEAKYKVKPQKINIINLPAKKTFKRGIRGSKSAVKKAMVYLKAGEKVEIV